MTATTTILTSYAGMHYHLPRLYLPEEKLDRMDRFLARAEPNTLAKALDDRPDRFAEEQPLGGMSFDALPLQ